MIVDWRGTPVVFGSIIVYAVKESTSIRLVEAKVLEIKQEPHAWRDEMTPVLKVQPLRETGWGWGTIHKRPRTIRALNNITVMPKADTVTSSDEAVIQALIGSSE